jgi:predicted DNA-binding transcriptional regulator YafY
MRILRAKKKTTVQYLANCLGAPDRTVRRDILLLSTEEYFPIVTVQGHDGGVMLTSLNHPHEDIFTREQNEMLEELLHTAHPKYRGVIAELLNTYGKSISSGEENAM